MPEVGPTRGPKTPGVLIDRLSDAPASVTPPLSRPNGGRELGGRASEGREWRLGIQTRCTVSYSFLYSLSSRACLRPNRHLPALPTRGSAPVPPRAQTQLSLALNGDPSSPWFTEEVSRLRVLGKELRVDLVVGKELWFLGVVGEDRMDWFSISLLPPFLCVPTRPFLGKGRNR